MTVFPDACARPTILRTRTSPSSRERSCRRWSPRFRSRFGGLWTDLTVAHDVLAGKRALGWVNDEEAERLAAFIDHGFVILEGAVPEATIEAVLADVEATLDGRLPPRDAEWWTHEGKQHGRATRAIMREDAAKMLDLHATSPATQAMIFAPPIARFLELVFERPPLAFQSLTFELGTRQPVHQDTAFVRVSSAPRARRVLGGARGHHARLGRAHVLPGQPRVARGALRGPLEVGAERNDRRPRLQRSPARARARGGAVADALLPRRGDALFWAADLVHGGAPDVEPGRTRRSHVTHYCPLDRSPMYLVGAPADRKRASVNGGYVCEDSRG
ncbi:MAG: phytanoyl-CoA dioxygenase family protein [Sandaracinaceae bacterium]|nr:phytanoyl-CoA dioxygenase family protein [Sandaracinaceae bacterium]